MNSQDEVKKLVGQLFMVGFDGFSVPSDFRKGMLEYNIGGVIYFKRNVQSPAQLAELSNEIQFSCRGGALPLFIAIDHEGGKINRLVKPFTKFPGNEHLGEINSPKITFECGLVLGKELKAVGINMNLAPVVDVYTNLKNTVIKSRAFSSDPDICAKLGSAMCRGIQKAGVISVAKHFPGHGGTMEDSHYVLPKHEKTVEQLEALELIPFRRVIRSRIEGIMTAHILNSAIDPKYPATLSKLTIDGLLRKELRFSRFVITDDLEMGAISNEFGKEEAAILAIEAGSDCLLYRGDEGLPVSVIEAVIKAVESERISSQRIMESINRMNALRKNYIDISKPINVLDVGKYIGLPQHFRLADIILKKDFSEIAKYKSLAEES